MDNRFFAFACLAASMAIVGANIAIGKAIVAELPVALFAVLRFAIASVILLPGLLQARVREGLSGSAVPGVFGQAFFGCFLFSLLMLHGVAATSAGSAGIITSTTPSVVALLAWLLLKERINTTGAIAIGFAVVGIVLVNVGTSGLVETTNTIGNLLVLGAVVSEATFAVLSRKIASTMHPWTIAFSVNAVALLLFLPLALPQALAFDWSAPTGIVWVSVIGYSISASVLSFLLWYRGISQVPANVAGIFTGLIPVTAVLVAVLAYGEQLAGGQIAGMVLVLAAIWLRLR